MIKFMLKLTYFLLSLFAISFLFNSIIRNNYTGLYEIVNLDFDSYLIADSHGLSIKDNLRKNEIYNFSASSDSYFDIYRKIKYLINYSNVKRIYLTVDDHTLSPYRESANNLDRSTYYADKDEFSNNIDYVLNKLISNVPFFKPKSRDIVKSKIKSYLFVNSNVNTTSDWSKLTNSQKKSSCLTRVKTQFGYKNQSSQLTNKLQEIILLCKHNNIELIGIKFPLSQTYVEILNNKNFGADNIFLENNLETWDFKDEFIMNPEYFANQDHLNEIGGYNFSNILIKKIIAYNKQLH